MIQDALTVGFGLQVFGIQKAFLLQKNIINASFGLGASLRNPFFFF